MNPNIKYHSFTSQNRSLEKAVEIYDLRMQDAREIFEKYSHTFIKRECPYCGSSRSVNYDKFDGKYGIDKCNSCSSIFVNPVPSSDALNYYYNNCLCNNKLGDILRKRHNKNNITISSRSNKIYDLIAGYALSENKRKIRLLEIGCNSGIFLSELRSILQERLPDVDIDLVGIDIDENAINKNVDSRNTLIAKSAEEFTATSEFDFVVHFELIEHLQDPYLFNCAVNSLLCPNGIVFFTTPNVNGFDNIAIGYNKRRLLAHGIFPPMHLNAFSPSNIPIFSIRSDFDVVSIDTPGIFDVDITRLSYDEIDTSSVFKDIIEFEKKHLAIIQLWLQRLKASSHMEVVLRKATGASN